MPQINFSSKYHAWYKKCYKEKNMCVIALVMFYESGGNNTKTVFMVFSCVLYYVTENYVCIEYLCCQYKKLSVICSDKMFTTTSYNKLPGIGIPEVLTNLISFHGFTIKNSTFILLWRNRLVKIYLEKGFVILQHNSKHLSSVPNEEKQRIHAIDIHKSDFSCLFTHKFFM